MRCDKVDVLGFLEGREPEGVKDHIEHCVKCKKETEKLKVFMQIVNQGYVKEKRMGKEILEEMGHLDLSNMKELPGDIANKVSKLKNKSISQRLGKALGKRDISEVPFFDGTRNGREMPLAAIPKDIAKSKNKRRK